VQRIPDLMRLAGIDKGTVVADVGAGSGFLTSRLAAAVGLSGKVYAVDISPKAVKSSRTGVNAESQFGRELRLEAAGEFRRSEGCREQSAVLDTFEQWEAARIGKGWT
jgi:tRNA A58 N-methylase Trm61